MKQTFRMSHIAAVAIVVAAAGCSDSAGVQRPSESQLGFTVGSSATSNAALAAAVPITKNGHTLDLSLVTLTLARAELKSSTTVACVMDDEEHGKHDIEKHDRDCADVKVGPTSVDLPLSGGVVPRGHRRMFGLPNAAMYSAAEMNSLTEPM